MREPTIRPSDFAPLLGDALGDAFVLVTSPRVREGVTVVPEAGIEVHEHRWEGPASRRRLVEQLGELQKAGRSACVVWIADDEFEHYADDELKGARLVAISSFSVPITPEWLTRTLKIIRDTDYARELRVERELLSHFDGAQRILFRTPARAAAAVFDYHTAEHWFSLHGALSPGQQVVLPTGELSALVNASGEFNDGAHFELNGEFVLKGQPIVHRGSRDVSLSDTRAVFEELSAMRDHAVIAELRDGVCQRLRSPSPDNPFKDALERLFEKNARYRKIHEIGFGTNPNCKALVAGNFFANERYPGVHLGIGLGGHTDFHIDLVCTEVEVVFEYADGRVVDLYQTLEGVA
jgi:hypothetical protein